MALTFCDSELITSFHEPGIRWPELGSLVAPLSKFKYPVEKRRTAENVEALRAAEKNLDAFWLKVDRELLDKNGIPLRERLVHILPYGKLERTPKWVEPTEAADTVSNLLGYHSPPFEGPSPPHHQSHCMIRCKVSSGQQDTYAVIPSFSVFKLDMLITFVYRNKSPWQNLLTVFQELDKPRRSPVGLNQTPRSKPRPKAQRNLQNPRSQSHSRKICHSMTSNQTSRSANAP
jgi:hypothetical protein